MGVRACACKKSHFSLACLGRGSPDATEVHRGVDRRLHTQLVIARSVVMVRAMVVMEVVAGASALVVLVYTSGGS